MDEAAYSRDNFYKVKRHQHPIMANTDIIAAQLIDSTSPVLGLRLCFGTSMSHCFPPAPFTNSHSLTLRASRPCRPLPRTPLKLARCPHLLAASLAALPSMSLLPFTPLIRSFPRSSSVTITDLTVHLARSHDSIVDELQAALAQFAEVAGDPKR